MTDEEPMFRVDGLKVHFPILGGILKRPIAWVHAVDGISFTIRAGETLGIVGESGCGKTTVGRALLRLVKSTEGSIRFTPPSNGTPSQSLELTKVSRRDLRRLRQSIQIIFQDPTSSLDPRQLVKSIVAEPIRIHRETASRCVTCGELVPLQLERPGVLCPRCGGDTEAVPLRGSDLENRVVELLDRVGLNPEHLFRYPHEFSGGQKQRIAITRALSLRPEFLVLDEPTSSLDVSVQSQILNLLKELQRDYRLTYLFISHNLAVVRHMADRVAVMYLGRFIEVAGKRDLFDDPLHPYTRGLLETIPVPDPERRRELALMKGEVPSPVSPPLGCRFHPRCPVAMPHCGWEGRDLQKVLEDAIRDAPADSPLYGMAIDMEPEGFRLRVRFEAEPDGPRAALEALLREGRARGTPIFEAIETSSVEDDEFVISFRDVPEPELKEVKPGHVVACLLYE